MRLEWSELAEADREGIEAYFGQYNLRAAIAAGDRIEEHVDLLESFPEMGQEGRVPGTRELVVSGSDCVVVYRLGADVVRILRVIHGGQMWPEAV